MSSRGRTILIILGALLVIFVVFQLIPWGTLVPLLARTNPPVVSQIPWNSPETEQLVRTTCYDCHSNETVWPWYSQIVPVSWLVAGDVNEGREALNFSEQSANQIEADELVREIEAGKMPPSSYLRQHPAANLSDAQKEQLIAGIQASLSGTGDGSENRQSDGDDD